VGLNIDIERHATQTGTVANKHDTQWTQTHAILHHAPVVCLQF